jgi:hypothetical protein
MTMKRLFGFGGKTLEEKEPSKDPDKSIDDTSSDKDSQDNHEHENTSPSQSFGTFLRRALRVKIFSFFVFLSRGRFFMSASTLCL